MIFKLSKLNLPDMKLLISIIILTVFLCSEGNAQQETTKLIGPYLGQNPPGLIPVKFLPDILTSEKHPHGQLAFSHDGRLVLWSAMIEDGPEQTIFFSSFDGQKISPPEIIPFASESGNGGPAFSRDGKRVYYSAQLSDTGISVQKPTAICYVDRNETGWTSPAVINITVDTLTTKGQVTVARNGNIYFSGRILTERTPAIYICRYSNGGYVKPEKIKGPISTISLAVDPWIDPDEKFLLLSIPPEEGPPTMTDIGISFPDENGGWSLPVRLNKTINTEAFERFPALSGDSKFLFFIRSPGRQFVNEQAQFYWVSTKKLKELRPMK
jgi:hypothetical protein